ncbi:cell division initiation protein [Streptomyces antimicrobicus]|uniref:Cell division initiation protein n=1 Tax=Streptomyces antimicrobicus TaxID=2883108 RepID=A0ABS8BDK7_9ACTN|nr:cell division initiation protein [Streptomyces antimicrobicus]MCB5182634.1 cell division initiation protein [Streptomyces antimicrobicus]
MDVQKKLDAIVATVAGARSMPMSASCVVNRAELLALLDEVRQALPGSLAEAQELLGGRDRMVEEAHREAERIIQSAHARSGSLISDTEVARRSQDEAERILARAREEAAAIRAEADDYVDSKLANFEVVLTKTIGSVDRGRDKLLGRSTGYDEHGRPDTDAPERSDDPELRRRQADDYVDTKLATFEAVLAKTLEAVGRGRQKLLGRVPSDDLGAHIAAQDAAGVPQPRPGRGHSTGAGADADFLAGLAEPDPEPVARPEPVPAAQPEPGWATYAYPQQQAYQEPYGDWSQQPDPYAAAGYAQAPDPYAAAYQQHPVPAPHAQPALDETSFFDTSMIDMEQLRRYEQGR